MNIADITGKIGPNSLSQAKNLIDSIYSYELNGKKVCQSKIFETILSFFESLDYQNKWLADDSLDKFDFRFQTFAKIELHSLEYHLSIVSTKNDIENLVNECLSLGYSLEFAIGSVGFWREYNLRVSFWDRFFYTVEYFVQQMNAKCNFIRDESTHSKRHYFQVMLNHFGIGSDGIETSEIVNIFSKHYPDQDSEFIEEISQNLENKSIKFGKLYEYAATLRNCLHNNGFSNKSLNNLNIGITQFNGIKKHESVNCYSVFHLLSLAFVITEVLQRVTQKSIDMYPGEVMLDPYLKAMDDHIKAMDDHKSLP